MNNFKQELIDANRIQKIYHPNETVEISGFGTIKDIIFGIDATIGGVTYQIKPLSNVSSKDGSIFVNVGFSNANNYKDKPVDRIAFSKNSELYVFKNNGELIGNTYKFNKEDLVKPKRD